MTASLRPYRVTVAIGRKGPMGDVTPEAQAARADAISAQAAAETASFVSVAANSQAQTANSQAQSAREAAQAARDAAQAARDAAAVNAEVYATIAAGLAATSDGEQFQVAGETELIRYRNDAGSATELARIPTSAALSQVTDLIRADAQPEMLVTFEDTTGEPFAGFTDAGGLLLPGTSGRTVQELIPLPGGNSAVLFSFNDSAGVPIMGLDAQGDLYLPKLGNHPAQRMMYAPGGDGILHQIQDSAGTPVVTLRANGKLFLPGLARSAQEEIGLGKTALDILGGEPFPVPEKPFLDTAPRWRFDWDASSPLSQRVPTVARTGGRQWAAWYSNNLIANEGPGDYVNLAYSDDDWATNVEYSHLVFDSPLRRMYDPHLWTDPEGKLWLFISVTETGFFDGVQGVWASVCANPTAARPAFGAAFRLTYYGCAAMPKTIGHRVLMPIDYWRANGPPRYPNLAGKNLFEFDWHAGRVSKIGQLPRSIQGEQYDETNIVELTDGRILGAWRSQRPTGTFGTERAFSSDGGVTWGEPEIWTAIGNNPNSRIGLYRSPTSGRLVLAYNNASNRSNLTVALSEDDGETWPMKLILDPLVGTSYPHISFDGLGNMTVVHDRNRLTEKAVFAHTLNEEQLAAGTATPVMRTITAKGA